MKHMNAHPDSVSTVVFEKTQGFFRRHPQVRYFARPVVPGEFNEMKQDMPADFDPAWVLVFHVEADTFARVPMSKVSDEYDGFVLDANWKAVRFPSVRHC